MMRFYNKPRIAKDLMDVAMRSFLVMFLVISGLTVFSQVTWDGGAGTNLWSDGDNWNPNGVPDDDDDVLIAGNYTVSVTSSDSCASVQLFPANSNNRQINLVITNGAHLGVSGDFDMDDRDRSTNKTLLDVEDGASLNVAGDLNVDKDNGSSNDNDMLLRISDDGSLVRVRGTLNADFTGNNNNGNDMGFRLSDDAGLIADSIYILLGGSRESNTLISVNGTGGAAGDSAFIQVLSGFLIANNSGTMDCVIDMDYEGTLEVANDFGYSGANGEGLYWYMDRDVIVDIGRDLNLNKDGNEEVYFYLNQNAAGSADDVQMNIGRDANLIKTDGDDFFIYLDEDADITITGDLLIDSSNEDDNGDDINIRLRDDAAIDVGGKFEFLFEDNNQTDFLLRLEDNSNFQIAGSFTGAQTNSDFYEVEINDDATFAIGGDFTFTNTSTSNVPVLDMDDDATLTVGGDFIWENNSTENGSFGGLYLDRNASMTVTDTLRFNNNTDGNLYIYLNQASNGDADDAQITANTMYLRHRNGDDLYLYMYDHADITLTNDLVIDASLQDGNGDDVRVFLDDDAGLDIAGDISIAYGDNGANDLFIRLNDNSSIDLAGSVYITEDNSHFMEVEMNDASSFDIGGDFSLVNTTSSNIPYFDFHNTASMTIGEDLIWTDNSDVNDGSSGWFMDGDASIAVGDSVIVTKPTDGRFRFEMNVAAAGTGDDCRFSAGTFVMDADNCDYINFRFDEDSELNVTGDLIIDANQSAGDDHVYLQTNDNGGANIGGDFSVTVNSTNNVDIDWNLYSSDSINVGGDITLDIQDGDDMFIDMRNGSVITVGDDWSMSIANADNLTLDMINSSVVEVADRLSMSVTANCDLLQIDNANTSSLSCNDLIAEVYSNQTIINHGIFLDNDATLTVTDSIYWIQDDEGYTYFYFNQSADGSGADVQVSANSFTVDRDNGDLLSMRLGNDADLMITNDLTIDCATMENSDHAEIRLYGQSGIDINGDLVFSNASVLDNDIRLYNFGSGDLDVAGNMDIDLAGGDDVDMDVQGSGSFIIGGDLTIDVSDGDYVDLYMDDLGGIQVGGDWITNMTTSNNFTIDAYAESDVSVTDRFKVTMDGDGGFVQIDMDSNTTFTASDFIVDHQGDNATTNGIFLDRDASITITDSVFWTQGRNGALYIYLNSSADGYAADAQLSAGHLIIDKDSGNLLLVRTRQDGDIAVTNNFEINVDQQFQDQNVQIEMGNNSGIDVNGDMLIDVNTSNSGVDIDMNLSMTGALDIAGDYIATIPEGDDFDANFSGDGQWNVGGDLVVLLTDADVLDFDLTNDAAISVTGDVDLRNANTGCRRVRIDMDNTSSFDVGEDLIMYNETTDNNDSETYLRLDRDATMTVGDSLVMIHDGNDDLLLELNQENDGSSADAQLSAGFIYLDFEGGDNLDVELSDDADISVSNDFEINYKTTEGTNDRMLFEINDDASISVDRTLDIDYNNGFSSAVQDFIFDLDGNGVLNVGPSAGPYNTESFTLRMSNGDDVIMYIDDAAIMNVYGDFNIIKTGADDLDFRTNNGSGTTVAVNIYGDIDIDNTENADFLGFDLNQSSVLDVDGDIDLQGITSQSQVEINMDGTSTLEIAGNFVLGTSPNNFGTLDMNNNSVLVFDGSAVQQVVQPNDGGGTDYFDYQFVEINNSFGTVPQLTMGGDALILQSVDFQDGILYSSVDSLMSVDDDAVATNASDASHVIGTIQKIGNDTFSFPVGNGSQHRPCGVSAPGNATDAFSGRYINVSPWDIYGTDRELTLDHVSTREYWIITRDIGTSDVKVELSWDTNSGGVTDLSELRIAHWTGSLWEDEGNFSTTGNTTTGTVTSGNVITSFSPFTLGSSTTNNPLPVELIEFDVTPIGDKVAYLHWSTATETNNDYFRVQRSINGIDFDDIGVVKGAGNSSRMNQYQYTDDEAFDGINYYRLIQVDFDGSTQPSSIELVEFTGTNEQPSIVAFPNPTADGTVNLLSLSNSFDQNTAVVVRDVMGRIIPAQFQQANNAIQVQLSTSASNGVYFMTVHQGSVEEHFTIQLAR